MLKGNNPVDILGNLLLKLIPGNYKSYGEQYVWKISKSFSDSDFSGWETIEEKFLCDYKIVVSQIQQAWGLPKFRGDRETSGYPDWFWIDAIDLCYWVREEGIAYIAFHREDRELPFEIDLGAITGMAIEELTEYRSSK